jgi:hypothetical protein
VTTFHQQFSNVRHQFGYVRLEKYFLRYGGNTENAITHYKCNIELSEVQWINPSSAMMRGFLGKKMFHFGKMMYFCKK